MKKKELTTLMNINEGRRELKIDECRKLVYSIADYACIDPNEFTGKKDVLELQFTTNIPYGDILDFYNIKSREPNGILDEIKQYTDKYFKDCIELLNGNKFLANNWK